MKNDGMWRARARFVIDGVLLAHRAVTPEQAHANELVASDADAEGRHDEARAIRASSWTIDPKLVLKAIDAAYPFGERAMHPYKMWLKERARARLVLFPTKGIARRCETCGARRGVACFNVQPHGGQGVMFASDEPTMHVARWRS